METGGTRLFYARRVRLVDRERRRQERERERERERYRRRRRRRLIWDLGRASAVGSIRTVQIVDLKSRGKPAMDAGDVEAIAMLIWRR